MKNSIKQRQHITQQEQRHRTAVACRTATTATTATDECVLYASRGLLVCSCAVVPGRVDACADASGGMYNHKKKN